LDRITLFSEQTFVELMASDLLRSRIAYPEQRHLPMKFASNQYSLYPKRYGAHQLIDAIVSQLKRHSVHLLRSSQVCRLEIDGRWVRRLTVETPEGPMDFLRPRSVLWTCGISPLARHLGLPSRERPFQSVKKPAAASLLVKKRPEVGDLHYFWCFDPEFQSYRTTFYHNFTSIETLEGLFPIGMEFALNPDFKGGRKALLDLAMGELRRYGLIQDEAEVAFATGDILPAGFPCYSTANKALLETLLAELRQRSIENLHLSGIQAEWGLIYQPDVLAHAYRTVQSILKSEPEI
jgi:protoporphyrinogen oxidase